MVFPVSPRHIGRIPAPAPARRTSSGSPLETTLLRAVVWLHPNSLEQTTNYFCIYHKPLLPYSFLRLNLFFLGCACFLQSTAVANGNMSISETPKAFSLPLGNLQEEKYITQPFPKRSLVEAA